MRRFNRKLIRYFPQTCFVVFLLTHHLIWGNPNSTRPFFLCYGRLFSVDTRIPRIEQRGSFDKATPNVARAPDGIFWGRINNQAIAAIDPVSGTEIARVSLPDTPYKILITENNLGYITHTTLTRNGFSLSVVDFQEKTVVRQINGIQGLVTDMEQWGPYVYLTALGVRRPSIIYLYRIDTRDNSLHELLHAPAKSHYWQLSIHGDNIYLCAISGDIDPVASIDVLDLRNGRIIDTLSKMRLDGVARILEAIYFFGEIGYFPCRKQNGQPAIGVFSVSSNSLRDFLPVAGNVATIIGIQDNYLLYRDSSLTAGKEGVRLYFYDLELKKEASFINVRRWMLNSHEQL